MWQQRWIFTYAVVIATSLGIITVGYAQSNDSTIMSHRLTLQGDVERSDSPIHKDVLARPCLTYEAISRAHITNPDIYDNIVSVSNHCQQRVKIHLSYEKSERFIELDIPANDRKEVILGTFTNSRFFRYRSKEIF